MKYKKYNEPTKYYDLIDFLLDLKSEIDFNHMLDDYMHPIDMIENFISYKSINTGRIISMYFDNIKDIPTLPPFQSYWSFALVKWIKKNGNELERLSKLKGFL